VLESYKDVTSFSRGQRLPQDAPIHDAYWELIIRTSDQNPAIQLVCQQIVYDTCAIEFSEEVNRRNGTIHPIIDFRGQLLNSLSIKGNIGRSTDP
jgi:hypothetical protein